MADMDKETTTLSTTDKPQIYMMTLAVGLVLGGVATETMGEDRKGGNSFRLNWIGSVDRAFSTMTAPTYSTILPHS